MKGDQEHLDRIRVLSDFSAKFGYIVLLPHSPLHPTHSMLKGIKTPSLSRHRLQALELAVSLHELIDTQAAVIDRGIHGCNLIRLHWIERKALYAIESIREIGRALFLALDSPLELHRCRWGVLTASIGKLIPAMKSPTANPKATGIVWYVR